MNLKIARYLVALLIVIAAFFLGKYWPFSKTKANQISNINFSGFSQNEIQNARVLYSTVEGNLALEDLSLGQSLELIVLEEQLLRQKQNLIEKIALKNILLQKDENKDKPAKELLTLNELLGIEIENKEIKEFYEKNKSSFSKDLTFEKLKPNLEDHLRNIRTHNKTNELVANLYQQHKLVINRQNVLLPNVVIEEQPNVTLNPNGSKRLAILTNFTCTSCREIWPLLRTLAESQPQIKIDIYFYTLASTSVNYLAANALFCYQKKDDDFLRFVDELYLIPTSSYGDQNNFRKTLLQLPFIKDKSQDIKDCLSDKKDQDKDKNKDLERTLTLGKKMNIKTLESFYFLDGMPIIPRDEPSAVIKKIRDIVGASKI